jgi:hypothetical protein
MFFDTIFMAHYNFRKDLEVGKQTEKEALEHLSKHLNYDGAEFNDDNKYDIKLTIGDKFRTYEIKTDLMCGYTGNFALEYECRGKPSGIVTTEADYWIYKLDDGFYQISVERLKYLIDEAKYFRMVSGGDKGSHTKMFLFKLPLMKEEMFKL